MTIATFFNSPAGMYTAQSFCHAVIAAVLADRALKAWRIYDPLARQRFRLVVIIFPIFSFPLYQLVNSQRSSAAFRLHALFDINRWLNGELWGTVPLGLLFLALLAGSSLLFLIQEMAPILRHSLDPQDGDLEGTRHVAVPFVEAASKTLSLDPPQVFVLDDDEPVLFSTTGKNPVIYLSTGLLAALLPEQMEAALAHEMAHIARSRRPLLIALFVLRILHFYNPVTLVKFRRAVRDEEKICDDIAVSLTRNPQALAGALRHFYRKPSLPVREERVALPQLADSLEEYSHNLHLESRIRRLERSEDPDPAGWKMPFAATVLAIVVLNYFIV